MKTRTPSSNSRRKHLQRTFLTVVAVIAILRPYLFSFASTETTFTLNNKTRYYLHAHINNDTYVYVGPSRSVVVEVVAPTSVWAKVRYSPGQIAKGTGERTIEISTTVITSGGSNTCTDKNGSTCNSTEPTTNERVIPGRWDVVETDLTAE